MEIFNIGLGELFLIFIIALLVFGPERLPELARQTARFINQLRGMADEVQRAIMTETQTITNPLEETKKEISSISTPFKDVKKTLSAPLITPAATGARTAAKSAQSATAAQAESGEGEQARAYDAHADEVLATELEATVAPSSETPVVEVTTYKPVSRNGDENGSV